MNKATYTQLAIITMSVIALFLVLNKCDSNPNSIHNYPIIIDNKLAEIESLKLFISKQDSIINAKQDTVIVYRTKFKTKYDTLIKQAPDTCKPYLTSLYKDCTKLDSLNQSLINMQSIQIDTLKHQVNQYIQLDSLKSKAFNDTIVNIKKDLKRSKRKAFINLFKGGAVGFGIGYLTGKLI
jgi:hypothetical protein